MEAEKETMVAARVAAEKKKLEEDFSNKEIDTRVQIQELSADFYEAEAKKKEAEEKLAAKEKEAEEKLEAQKKETEEKLAAKDKEIEEKKKEP